MNIWISIIWAVMVGWLVTGYIAFAGKPRRGRRNRAESNESLIASEYQQNHHGIMIYSVLLMAFAIMFHLIEWQAYINKPDPADVYFAEQNQYYFVIAMIGFGGAAAVQIRGVIAPEWVFEIPNFAGKSTFATKLFFNRSALLKQFVVGLVMLIGVQLVFGVILRPFFGTVSDLEKSIFYFTGAISEELLYRLLIQQTLASVLRKIPAKPFKGAILSGMIAVVPTSIYFMSQHFAAYADAPLLFFGTFFLGVAFGVIYVISQNILIPMFLHAISNFLVSLQVVWGINFLGGTPGLSIDANGSIGVMYLVIAGLVIVASMVAVFNKKPREQQQPKQAEPVPAQEAIDQVKRSNKKAWIVLGIITIALLVVSILFDAWGWYVPTAGAP